MTEGTQLVMPEFISLSRMMLLRFSLMEYAVQRPHEISLVEVEKSQAGFLFQALVYHAITVEKAQQDPLMWIE
ncbi:hypothetical protein HAX54_031752 [Datura stramonium]|uniref:Uncharacterized protein n=1 Tax=Datura stramonium TaxID=4076 RepID=A0ABS8SC97_DATST|nr:hypothetical protein [Datura stramonium]